MAVVGYIRRQILQRMIEVALEEEAVRPDTPCIFSRRSVLFGFFCVGPSTIYLTDTPCILSRRLVLFGVCFVCLSAKYLTDTPCIFSGGWLGTKCTL